MRWCLGSGAAAGPWGDEVVSCRVEVARDHPSSQGGAEEGSGIGNGRDPVLHGSDRPGLLGCLGPKASKEKAHLAVEVAGVAEVPS